jgi:iron complex transport system substrate-binding protein
MRGGRSVVWIYLAALAGANGCGKTDGGVDVTPTIGEPRTRIISLAPHLTELVFTAGAGNFLVGVVEFSDFPAAARQLPRVGDSYRIDYEVVSRLAPDLILVWPSGTPPEVVNRLRELGFEVLALEPSRLDDIADHVLTIGQYAGTGQTASIEAAKFRAELQALSQRHKNSLSLRVFYQVSSQPYFTITGSHVIDEIIDLCGGQNVFADLNGLAPAVTLESILVADPEVIIGSVTVTGEPGPQRDEWRTPWLRWQRLTAVRNNNLFSVSADLVNRSSTRIIAGARQICADLEIAREQQAEVAAAMIERTGVTE